MPDILVFSSHKNGKLSDSSSELIYKARCLADVTGSNVIASVIGSEPDQSVIESAGNAGADSVICISAPWLAFPHESLYAAELFELIKKYQPDIVLITADSFGRGLAPRLSARLKTGLTADCTSLEIDTETSLLLQTRPAFGGNLYATMTCPSHKPQMATVRPGVFPKPKEKNEDFKIINEKPVTSSENDADIKILELIESSGEINIGEAKVLISVGRGAENYISLAFELAELIGGNVSASRPIIDDGLLPYPHQVGQTGKTVSPDLYIAIGISGSAQHIAGLAAGKVAAVNIDPDAPIFKHADLGIISDSGDFLRRAIQLAKKMPGA